VVGLLFLTHTVYNLIPVQPHRNARSSDVVTFACPSSSYSLNYYYYYYYYYYMIYIAPISRIESEALASLGGGVRC